jgi:hypothetical protein
MTDESLARMKRNRDKAFTLLKRSVDTVYRYGPGQTHMILNR